MDVRRLMRDGDVVSGAALAALGAYIFTTGSGYAYWSPSGPGPGFFPVWYGALMIALSLGLIVMRLFRPVEANEPIDWPGIGRALGTWAAFVAATLAMPAIGFVTAFTLFCFALIFFVFQRPAVQALVASLAISAVFHIIFVILLQVDLPAGPLGV